MHCAHPTPTRPLFSGEARVVQPTLADEVERSIRQIGTYIGRNRLNENLKLLLAEPDFLFCPLCLSNIDDRPCELEIIRIGFHWSRQNVNILDPIVGEEQAILVINGAAADRSSFYSLKHEIAIFRVNAFHDHIERDLVHRRVFEDAVGFV